jgi:hypothetical protein
MEDLLDRGVLRGLGHTVNRAYAADKTDSIAVSDNEAQWVLPFFGGEVVSPEV